MQLECIRVLLVEDDPGQVTVIKTLLRKAPGVEFQLQVADRLSAGLESLTMGGMDIVLLDLSLPDSSGVNTFVKVRQVAPRMPIIVLTGTDDELLATELMRRGAQDYLFKGTIDGSLLIRAIRYSIFRADSEEALKETQLLLIQVEKLRSLGQMAASVAHEVRNPLAILHMGIECLDEFFLEGNEVMSGVVKEMKGAVHRAEAIIRDMLDYSAAHELELREVSVNGLVDQTLGFVRHELIKTKVRVTTQFAEGPCACLLDAPKIEQVFINVFTNACHAMPGGGELSVTTSERVIESDDPEPEREDAEGPRFLRGDKVVTVEIRDRGSGIPEDKLGKLFDPFFTTKTSGNGTGLGLAVVKKIIELHEGKISIANADGGGARVTISLKSAPGLRCNQTPGEVNKLLA
ncbi:MAG: ATP-binding protein [Chthoniobacter sp.]|nr:ATP-binding protein [Chthoniobacter sp.]